MEVAAKFQTFVPIEKVWEIVVDPLNIGKTIPGCESVEIVDSKTYVSRVAVKVAYLKARFKLVSKLQEQEPPNRIITNTTGEGVGMLSNVSQKSTLQLSSLENGFTEVAISTELNISGTLANLGQRIIRAKVEVMVGEWAQSMKNLIESESGVVTELSI